MLKFRTSFHGGGQSTPLSNRYQEGDGELVRGQKHYGESCTPVSQTPPLVAAMPSRSPNTLTSVHSQWATTYFRVLGLERRD